MLKSSKYLARTLGTKLMNDDIRYRNNTKLLRGVKFHHKTSLLNSTTPGMPAGKVYKKLAINTLERRLPTLLTSFQYLQRLS